MAGWQLPFAYLWRGARAGNRVAVTLGACLWRFREAIHTRLTRAGLVGVVSVYSSLAISSTILHRFVVYGRLSRPLMPFLCLIGGAVIPRGWCVGRRFGSRRPSVVLCVATQAAFNFRVPSDRNFFPNSLPG